MTTSRTESVYILVVDDLEENLLALEALFRREGLELLKARSGPEALELLLKYEIALALVDVQMPDMTGFELAELMRGTERTRRVPIIFLTAGTADQQRQFRGYEAGAVDFIQKPIEPDVLKSKAEVFIELFHQRQEIARLLEESRGQAAALQEADRRKDEFLATLAHELRNPLAPLRNGLQVLKLAEGDVERTTAARELMERQLSHMVRLVDDLLDISRISQGKFELKRDRVSVSSVVEAAIEASRPTLEAGGHSFTLSLPNQPLLLNADPTRVAQMVSNLLTNAGKYTPDGGRIELSVFADDTDVFFRVKDTGVGIPSEMLPRVFEIFTQVGRTLDRAQGGLGIGLALVKQLVDMHSGSISAESEGVGRGSTFTIRLPHDSRKAGVVESLASHSKVTTPATLDSRRVLIVDDNIDGAESMATLLELSGHTTRTAHSGPDALEAVRDFRPEVVFLDIGLPGMDGYEVAQRIRAESQVERPMLIALTGWGSHDDRERSRNAGFDHHMTKPIELAQLEQILTQI